MKIGSLFSGIGGMDKGLADAGMEIRWHVEIDQWGQKVLSHRFPEGQLYSDIRERRHYEWVDLISFGFPCTDLSVAGRRAGLGGDETRLFWAAIAIVRRVKPTWLLIENVTGLLSSNGGRDFGVVLGALAHSGYWWSYRVLDSQYFGVAQRRRRVFIVGHLGSPCPAEILFEPKGITGHLETRSEAGQGVARALTESLGHHGHGSPRGDGGDNLVVGSLQGGGKRGWRVSAEQAAGGHIVAHPIAEWQQNGGGMSALVSHPLLAKGNSSFDDSLETYVIQDARGVRNKAQNGIGITEGGSMFTLDGTSQHAIAVAPTLMGSRAGTARTGGPRLAAEADYLISEAPNPAGVREATGTVRRLDLSLQCKCPDSPRYSGLGNAVTAPVAEWIGRRILQCLGRPD